MPFYKTANQTTLIGPSEVIKDIVTEEIITDLNKDQFTFPIDGWYWFENVNDAINQLIKVSDVTRAQAKLALKQFGLLSAVESIMSNPETPEEYKIAWNDAVMFKRNSPTVMALSQVLTLDEEALDNIFKFASTVENF